MADTVNNIVGDAAVQSAIVNLSASGDAIILAAQPGYRIIVVGFYISAAATVTLQFLDGLAGTPISGAFRVATNGTVSIPPTGISGVRLFATSVGTALVLNNSGAVVVTGAVFYKLLSL